MLVFLSAEKNEGVMEGEREEGGGEGSAKLFH